MTITPELIGGEPWQQALYRQVISRADGERELLAGYQKAADESHSGAFRYLAALLAEDAERHHRIMSEMARTLQTEVDYPREERAIPPVGQWGFERKHIVDLTEHFLAGERNGGRELRQLARDLEGVKDTTVWQLLVRLMETTSSGSATFKTTKVLALKSETSLPTEHPPAVASPRPRPNTSSRTNPIRPSLSNSATSTAASTSACNRRPIHP
jgi:hypothetical protein